MPSSRPQPRIAWPVVVLAALAVAGGLAAAVSNLRADDGGGADPGPTEQPTEAIDRVRSQPIPEGEVDAAAFTIGTPPAAGWRIDYLVTAVAAERHLERTIVVPPFDARTVVYEGPDEGTAVVTERELGLGVLATANRGSEPAVLAPEPTPAGPRPGSVLADGVRLGLVEARELRRVAGRVCRVYRTSGTRDGSVFRRPADTDDVLDLCIDADGLLLEEWQRFGGQGIRQRVAIAVEAPADALSVEEVRKLARTRVVAPRDGGGSLRQVDPSSRPQGQFFEVPGVPDGFTFAGRYGAVPPQPGFADPEQRGSVFATTVDVFVSGADLIVVEVGGTLDLSAPWEPDPDNPTVDVSGPLPQLGSAEVILGLAGGELRALVGDSGRFVKVRGTVPVAVLERVLRSLRPVSDGTGLVFLDD